ncbi:MAG: bacillithiol biosynthesis cysteine-adding enzyme BshC [Candidatus Acidiferrales bacterium]
MEFDCIGFREIPHSTKLFSTFLEDFAKVGAYYAHPPSENGVLASAREAKISPETRRALVEILREQSRRFGADESAEKNLARFAAGAAAIVTGQQVGLFGGPAYSFYKAITAAAWAKKLSDAGVETVPIFWLATEDHDLAEINHCFWPRRAGLTRLEIPAKESDLGHRAGEVALGDAVTQAAEAAASALEGPFALEIAAALRETYRPAENFGSAFGKLMSTILRGRGILFFDPLDPRVHRLSEGIYRRAIEEADPLASDLIARSKKLERAGFHAQVKIAESSTLLFMSVRGRREPLRRKNGEFIAGGERFTRADLLANLESQPELFTPNVLLRPVVQDALFPTATYIAGPAEIAYFAQASVVYARLGVRMPATAPRASFTLIEPRLARLLNKYKIEFRDVLRGKQHLHSRMALEFLPRGLRSRFERDEKAMRDLLRKLRAPVARLDKSLAGAVTTAELKMLYQFSKLRRKAGDAENFRTGLLSRDERILAEALYPNRALQERSLSLLPFLALHGPELFDLLSSRALESPAQHTLLFL